MTTRAPGRALSVLFALVSGGVVAPGCGRGLSPRVDDPAAAAEPQRAPAAVTAEPVRAPAPPAEPTRAPAPSAPGYTVVDLAAIQRTVHAHGRPVIAHFWASWCGPCLEELPLVDKFARDMKARGVDVVSLSLDDPDRAGAHVVEVLAARAPGLTRNIVKVSDSDAFINAIDPRWEGAIPAVFAFDDKGQLRDRLIGEATRRELDGLAARVAHGR